MVLVNMHQSLLWKEWLLRMVRVFVKYKAYKIVEPGYYKDGSFGIRIENILVVEKRGNGEFLGFRNITVVPYERKLIDLNLLSKSDIDYIDRYHKRVGS